MNRLTTLILNAVMWVPLVLQAQNYENSRTGLSSYWAPQDTQIVNESLAFKNPDKALKVSLVHTIVPVVLGTSIIVATFNGLLDFEYYDEEDQLQEAAGEFLLIGTGLTLYGLVVGPSAGLKYAEEYQRAKIGTYIRGGTIVTLIVGGFISSPELRLPIQLAALGGYTYSTVKSITSGPKMVHKFNDRLIKKSSICIGSRLIGRSPVPTVSLSIHF